MSRYTFISSDCHAAPKMPDYRPFVAAEHREAFDDWLAESQREAAEARRKRIGGNLFDEDYIEEAEKNNDLSSMWKWSRCLGGRGIGPKKRKMSCEK